ncbi:hypothetical protein NMG60_11028985 [Bertholletia excelsa]
MAGEQVRPLAPGAFRSSSDGGEAAKYVAKLRQQRWIKCCGCAAVLLLIQIVVVIVLIFTVFRVKDPVIKMNSVKIDHLELVNGTTPKPGTNMSLTADVSVKNPNAASFRYGNTTTALYYHGVMVGEARSPAGSSRARRTTRMNISVDIITDRMLDNPNLQGEIKSGLLTMSSFTKVGGRVKMLGIIKKHVVVRMNCTMSFNISSQLIQDQKCKRKVKL